MLNTFGDGPPPAANVFVIDQAILGAEFRQNPSSLSAFREDVFGNMFLAFLPLKYLAITAAFADRGNVADKPGQRE